MTLHIKRVLTSFVLLSFLIFFMFLASPYALCLAVFAISVLGLWEFYSLFWPGKKMLFLKLWGILLSFPIATHILLNCPLILALLLSLWSVNIIFLICYSQGCTYSWSDLQILTCGLLYIPSVLQFFCLLESIEILLVFVASFITDIGAYYCGTFWGRKKLWPNISPKKSWMGAWGGALACLLGCIVIGIISGKVSWYQWIWIGIILNLAAQFGDLFESALKRHLEIKDSGRLLPGHGGILDRFDSVLFVLPVYMILRNFYFPF